MHGCATRHRSLTGSAVPVSREADTRTRPHVAADRPAMPLSSDAAVGEASAPALNQLRTPSPVLCCCPHRALHTPHFAHSPSAPHLTLTRCSPTRFTDRSSPYPPCPIDSCLFYPVNSRAHPTHHDRRRSLTAVSSLPRLPPSRPSPYLLLLPFSSLPCRDHPHRLRNQRPPRPHILRSSPHRHHRPPHQHRPRNSYPYSSTPSPLSPSLTPSPTLQSHPYPPSLLHSRTA